MELTVVISIIAILMVAGVGLLRGTGAQSAKVAIDQLQAQIERARSLAITSRARVILAIAEPGDLKDGTNVLHTGIFKVAPEDWNDGIGTIRCTQTSRWKKLPPGVVPVKGSRSNLGNMMDSNQITIEVIKNNQTMEVHALVFSPMGQREIPSVQAPVVLGLTEGRYLKETAVPRKPSESPADTMLKIGRSVARAYRIDG